MTLRQALVRAREELARHPSIDNPSLVAEILLRHALQISRAQLYLDINQELPQKKEKELWQMVERQLQGEPIAYITRHREFYGLDFYVDPRVLIPRPESELLVEQALEYLRSNPEATVADIGTGSGAIAISLAVNLPHPSERGRKTSQFEKPANDSGFNETQNTALKSTGARGNRITSPSEFKIFATDVSPSALEVARINCQKHGVLERIRLLQGYLLNPLPGPADLIIANLPYVQKAEIAAMKSAKYEPVLALDGGENGLDKIFQLCQQLKNKMDPHGCLLMEVGMGQSPAITDYLRQLYPAADIQVLPDLAGIGRVVKMLHS